MSMPLSPRLTAGEVARQVGVDIPTVLDLVYQGQLEGRPDRHSGRLYVSVESLERFRAERADG